jgi:pectate lyase
MPALIRALAVLATLPCATPSPAAVPQAGAYYTLTSVRSNLVLGIPGGSATSGVQADQESDTNCLCQQWQFVDNGDGWYRIQSRASGKVLDVQAHGDAQGTPLVQWEWHGSNNQLWRLADTPDGSVKLESRSSGYVADVTDASMRPGAGLQQWNDWNGANQRWRLAQVKADARSGTHVSAAGAWRVDVFVNGRYVGQAGDVAPSAAIAAALVPGAENIIGLRATSTSPQNRHVFAELAGAFGRVGTSALWRAKAATPAEVSEPVGAWTTTAFDDADWSVASPKDAATPEGFPVDGPARAIWSASDADATVLARLRVYLPLGLDANVPTGFAQGVTGGGGGEVVRVSTPQALAYQLCRSKDSRGYCADAVPRIIELSGMIDFRGTEGRSQESACVQKACTAPMKSELITPTFGACVGKPLQSVTVDTAALAPLQVGSNKTILGLGASSGIQGKGLTLRGGVSNIIVRNIHLTDLNSQLVWGGDALTIDGAKGVWIDHDHFARIGRQMIVSGWAPASNVTVSWNDFDGLTEFAAQCNGEHYWVMLALGSADTYTLHDNFIHDTSGRMPHAGGLNQASVAMHMVNNFFVRVGGHAANPQTPLASLLLEGNYFRKVTQPMQIDKANPGLAWMPIEGRASAGVDPCLSVLKRACQDNVANPMPADGVAQMPLDLAALRKVAATGRPLVSPYPAREVQAVVPYLAGPGHLPQ